VYPERGQQHISLTIPQGGIDFDQVVGNFERSLLNQALAVSGGNKARAADLLRIKRTTLLAKLKSFEERENGACVAIPASPPVSLAASSTALVIEQDASVFKLIARTLEAEGYRVLGAENSSAAVELFRCWKTHIGLLVLDMSTNDAERSAPSWSELAPDLPTVEISRSTGRTHLGLRHRSKRVLSCPFSAEQLRSALHELSKSVTPTVETECCA